MIAVNREQTFYFPFSPGERRGLGYREIPRNKAKMGFTRERTSSLSKQKSVAGDGGKEALGTEGQGEVKGHGVWEPSLVVKYCGRCLGRAAEPELSSCF